LEARLPCITGHLFSVSLLIVKFQINIKFSLQKLWLFFYLTDLIYIGKYIKKECYIRFYQ
jgi:hypothetical protein